MVSLLFNCCLYQRCRNVFYAIQSLYFTAWIESSLNYSDVDDAVSPALFIIIAEDATTIMWQSIDYHNDVDDNEWKDASLTDFSVSCTAIRSCLYPVLYSVVSPLLVGCLFSGRELGLVVWVQIFTHYYYQFIFAFYGVNDNDDVHDVLCNVGSMIAVISLMVIRIIIMIMKHDYR